MRTHALLLCALAVATTRSGAQGVPPLSIELTGGSGAHTMHTRSVYYRPARATMLRFAATARLGPAGALRPVLTIEHATNCPPFFGCGEDAVCYVAPDHSCEQVFEGPSGDAAALGLAGAWSRYFNGGVAAGVAWYARRAVYLDANAALRIVPDVAWTVDARRVFSTNSRGERTWFLPVSMGVRIF